MAYTRTQVFKQMSDGTPVIRPMYLSKFSSSVKANNTITDMYMFGPAVLAQTDFIYSNKNYPKSNWCTVRGGISMSSICFETNPSS